MSQDLVKRVSECRCGIIVVVGTRSFSYTDREMNTVKELISIAEADMSLMELGDFDWVVFSILLYHFLYLPLVDSLLEVCC